VTAEKNIFYYYIKFGQDLAEPTFFMRALTGLIQNETSEYQTQLITGHICVWFWNGLLPYYFWSGIQMVS
jgi:hypothetical protein